MDPISSICCRLVAPVSSICRRSWLQCLQLLLAAPVLVSPVVRGSPASRLSLMAPVSVACDSSLQYLLIACGSRLRSVSPVVHGSGMISCRSWLQFWLVCRSCLQYLLSSWLQWLQAVAHGSSTIYCHFLWLQAVARCSCGCHGCLPFCGFNRQPSSVLVIFL